jgi:antitoxin (DNA-binding transcriptional repressor) of toxin-antitoxin stability system
MIEMSVTDFARNLRNVFDRIEHNGEEIILHRNKHRIARIIPGSPHLTAREAMGDLYRTLSDEAGATWLAESRLADTLKEESYNPWES